MTASAEPLAIVYQDRWLCAVDKPCGLMVHKSSRSTDRVFAVQRLRNQLGQRVWPLHRLDRATSGVLLFALDPETAAAVGRQIMAREFDKRYLAVVRGYTDPEGTIDHPLASSEKHAGQAALTTFRRLATMELPVPIGRYPVARYSLVQVWPQTGRTHQIRRHFKHIFHPLMGDTTYGEGRHNRLFRQQLGCHRLLLHAVQLGLRHPRTGETLDIRAPSSGAFRRVEELFLRHSLS
ncbi:MAG TPA: pseudouridine synthase [Wenzhouxiangella sp.]|nr:pseudouridine synthase [Wenzhouxiangella sp.]